MKDFICFLSSHTLRHALFSSSVARKSERVERHRSEKTALPQPTNQPTNQRTNQPALLSNTVSKADGGRRTVDGGRWTADGEKKKEVL